MRDLIEKVTDYFGKRYKNRELPRGIYHKDGKYVAITFNELGHTNTLLTTDDLGKALYALKDKVDGHHWYGIEHDPDNNFGFIYLITELSTGRKYIGSKQYRFWQGQKGGYKCTDVRDKDWWNPKLWKESDWRYYISSSKDLAPQIEADRADYYMEVLCLCQDKLSLMLKEIELQMEANVLEAEMEDGDYLYYNANVGRCLFRAPLSKSKMKLLINKSIEDVKEYVTMPERCVCGAVIPFGGMPCCV